MAGKDAGTPMETSTGSSDNPTPGGKRRKIEVSPTIKQNVLKWIIHGHIGLAQNMTPEFKNLNVIPDSCSLTRIFHSIHNALRQHQNGKGTIYDKIPDPIVLEAGQVSHKIDKALAIGIMGSTARKYGLEYSQGKAGWWGTAAPLLNFIVGFKCRYDELRLGHGKIPTGKQEEGKDNNEPISLYGLSGLHAPYLEGISFEPNIKSSMPQSLGALTQLIMLSKNPPTGEYIKKWQSAVQRSFQNNRYCAEIVKYLPGKSSEEAAQVIKPLADIILLTTARTISRAFFPFALMYATLEGNERLALKVTVTTGDGKTLYNVEGSITSAFVSGIDFSGKGAFAFWNENRKTKVKIRLDCDKNDAESIFFHSVWGTFCEDLKVINFMTDRTFKTRNELGACFQGASKKTPQEIDAIKINKYAKLSSSAMSTLMQSGQQQIHIRPVFSGKRNTKLGRNMLAYMEQTIDPRKAQITTLATLPSKLSAERDRLYRESLAKPTIIN